MAIKNFKMYFHGDKEKQKEFKGFIKRVEGFAKSILPRMGDEIQAFLDISELVGRGYVATLWIYGYNKIYNDEFELERVEDENSMKKQVGGIVKASIGNYNNIYASTYWNAKKQLGRKSVEIGPYVEIEFLEDSLYESQNLFEGRVAKKNSKTVDKLCWASSDVFGEDIVKKVNDTRDIIDGLGVRINKDNSKALKFVSDFGFKKVNSVGAHSQDKPEDNELDFLLDDKEKIAAAIDYLVKSSNQKRVVTFVNENEEVPIRKIIEAVEKVNLSKEDEKELEKTLLKAFRVNEGFKKSKQLDAKLISFCNKYSDSWESKGSSLKWSDINKQLVSFFGKEYNSFDEEKKDYIITYISIMLDDLGIDSEEVDESILEGRKKDGSDWTTDEVMQLIDTNDKVLYGALKYLYNEQTSDEKDSQSTKEHNGKGFNAYDAEFLSSLAEQVIKKGTLSEKQKMYARKKLVRYKKQLTNLANM